MEFKIERSELNVEPPRVVDPVWSDERSSAAIRPQSFAEYPGQEQASNNLQVYVKSALKRNAVLDHVLLHGPPGLGKTTLAHILANEMGKPFHSTSGPSVEKPGDLAGILASLESGSVLFIDEIHRLSIQVEEVLYSAMEDFCLDLVVGQGPAARTVRMPIAPFTLVGATTKVSKLSRPLLSRFGIQERLSFYPEAALVKILQQTASAMDIQLEIGGAVAIASCSRGTPRIAISLLKRVWDFAMVANMNAINDSIAAKAFIQLNINAVGLDRLDIAILDTIESLYGGGPVGIETISVSLGEERSTIEDVYEPYLVHKGFLMRTPRGRVITEIGRKQISKTD